MGMAKKIEQQLDGSGYPAAGKDGSVSRPVAILFSDLVESTQLFQRRGDNAATVLIKRMTKILSAELAKHDGTLTKTIGDALMVTFPKARKALACAIAMQRALADHNDTQPPADQLIIRIGVHFGQALEEASDVYGDTVNTAARIQAEAARGEIVSSYSTWQEARGLDTEAIPLGDFSLKGIKEKIHLVKVLWLSDDIANHRQHQLDHEILPSLAGELNKNRCLPVIGGLTLGLRKKSLQEKVAAKMATELGLSERRAQLSRMASLYEEENDSEEMLQFVSENLPEEETDNAKILEALATVSFDFILSTDLDQRLEQALRASGRKVRKFLGLSSADPSCLQPGEIGLVKVFGELASPESMAVTEEQVTARLDQLRFASEHLLAALATRHLLFVGFRWSDREFKRIFGALTSYQSADLLRATGISPRVAPGVRGTWRRRGLVLAQADEIDFLAQLKTACERKQREQLREQDQTPGNLVGSDASHKWKRPYKFLSYFTEDDEDIYFGREDESARLFSQVVSHRLVVLHAPSGAGKTSMLNAGLTPALRREGFVVIAIRCLSSPELEIRKALLALIQQAGGFKDEHWQTAELHPDLSLLLAEANQALGKPLVIVLDQFEEFFLKFPRKARLVFAKQLGELCKQAAGMLRIVLALRNDYLYQLTEFKNRIPEILHHEVGLESLTAPGMEQAVRLPAELAGLKFADGLVEKILTDLGTVGSEPPQLQIICDRLYDELESGEQEFTHKHYDGLGGAKGILGSYLERFLGERSPAGQALGREVLKALVTSADTKGIVTIEEVIQETNRPAKSIKAMMAHLLEARLIRKLQNNNDESFELSHEYLIDEIGGWIEEKDRDLKRTRELLRQELMNHQRFGLLIAPSRIEIIRERATELELSPAEESLLNQSIRHHRRKKTWLAGGIALAVALSLIASFFIVQYLRLGQCQGASAKLAGVWDDKIRSQIKSAFLATGKSFAPHAWSKVKTSFNSFSSQWVEMHSQACQATRISGEQSEEMLDLRMACLSRRLAEMNALAQVFTQADPQTVEKASTAAMSLTPLANCQNIAWLSSRLKPPADPATQAKVEKVRALFNQIEALSKTGKLAAGLKLAQQANKKAHDINYGPLIAEAQYQEGVLTHEFGHPKAAEKLFDNAMQTATKFGHDKYEAMAATFLVLYSGHFNKKFAEASIHARHAEAVIQRMGSPRALQAQLSRQMGAIYVVQGQFEKAKQECENSLKIKKTLFGPDHPEVGGSHINLGNIYHLLSDFESTLKNYTRALVIFENALGPNHPTVALTRLNIGGILTDAGKFPTARIHLEKAAAIYKETFGPDSMYLGECEGALGALFLGMKDYEQAMIHYRRCQSICTQKPCRTVVLSLTLFGMATVLAETNGDPKQIIKLAHRARNAIKDIKGYQKAVDDIDKFIKEFRSKPLPRKNQRQK